MSTNDTTTNTIEEAALEGRFLEVFTKPVIRVGQGTLIFAILFCFIPALYLWLHYGALPPLNSILGGWILIASIYGAFYVVEPISYFPILGLSGTYMAFLSGNIANMRVPCAAVAQEALQVEPGSKKAEIVGTLGIAGSIITNLIVVTIAAIGGNELFRFFPPVVVKAFEFVVPSIFGALFVMFAIKFPKIGLFAIALALFLLGVVKVLPPYVVIPINVFVTVAFGIQLNKWEKKKGGA